MRTSQTFLQKLPKNLEAFVREAISKQLKKYTLKQITLQHLSSTYLSGNINFIQYLNSRLWPYCLVVGEGFEPSKHAAGHLQCPPFDHSGIQPNS